MSTQGYKITLVSLQRLLVARLMINNGLPWSGTTFDIVTHCQLAVSAQLLTLFLYQYHQLPHRNLSPSSTLLSLSNHSLCTAMSLNHQITRANNLTTTMSTSQPYPTWISPIRDCDNPKNQLHTLHCSHTIIACPITSVYINPSITSKTPCSPNCTHGVYATKSSLPTTSFQNTDSRPFVCPMCIENQTRSTYDSLLEQHRRGGGMFSNDVETNIRLWTYGGVFERIKQGGRMCECTIGVFRLKYVEGFRSLLGRRAKRNQGELLATWGPRSAESMVKIWHQSKEGKGEMQKQFAVEDIDIDELAD